MVAEQPCTLVYACVAEPGLAQSKAALFLDVLQVSLTLLVDDSLRELILSSINVLQLPAFFGIFRTLYASS